MIVTHLTVVSNATLTETGGGMTVTAGPVTQQS